jgi:5-formyltetrahydrofolate cyclo-ligase
MLARRRALTHEEWCASSHAAQLNLLVLDEYVQAVTVALYAPHHNETDTALILTSAFEAGKRVLYPAVCGGEMVLRSVTSIAELRAGAFGILEPCPTGGDHQADVVDLVVVPGVAFDRTGHRLGYGKGFYDRFLNNPGRAAHLVGLCHDFQVTETGIPTDIHDIPMEIIVSDKRVLRVKQVETGK